MGAYGDGWIKTPNLDALAKQSLLFTRSYPESIPTIPARRAIHTGVRTWPFRDWHPVSDDTTGKPYWALYPELTDTVFMMRHPGGRGADNRSDYYASTHDVAPTILSMLGIENPEQMEGTDLSPLFEGEEPDQRREHFTLGYNDYVWTRGERHVVFSTNTGEEAKLHDVSQDPQMRKNLAGEHPETVKRMFSEYVLEDAGGPLPNY